MASAWGSSWGDAWGDSWGTVSQDLKGRIVRRGKYKVWDKDPWDLPEKEIVEATAAQLESLIDQKDYLKVELKETKGAELREERRKITESLTALNKQIERTKQSLAKQKADYQKAEALAVKRAAEEEEDIRAIITIVMDLYDD